MYSWPWVRKWTVRQGQLIYFSFLRFMTSWNVKMDTKINSAPNTFYESTYECSSWRRFNFEFQSHPSRSRTSIQKILNSVISIMLETSPTLLRSRLCRELVCIRSEMRHFLGCSRLGYSTATEVTMIKFTVLRKATSLRTILINELSRYTGYWDIWPERQAPKGLNSFFFVWFFFFPNIGVRCPIT